MSCEHTGRGVVAEVSEAANENPTPKPAAPWRGRRRVDDARTKFISVRCTEQEWETIDEAAKRAGLSIGAYLRTLACGSAGPRAVRRPPVERRELARLLGHLGKVGSNLNQLARAFNRDRQAPELAELTAMRQEIRELRDALITALGHDH
jgi:hypothetical protein